MLNEKQLEALPERISLRLRQVNELALQKIGERIKKIGEMKPSDVHKVKQLMTYGSGYDEIVSKLAEVSKKNEQDIYDIFDVIANMSSQAEELAKAKQISFKSYKDNEQLKQFVNAMAKQTADTYRNMTNTIAFMRRDENGKRVLTSLSKTYQDITDKAITAVATGVEDYQSAMRQVIKDLADSGLRTKYQPLKGSAGKAVDYASGYSRRLDTAVRQNILWGVKECNQNMSDMLGEELGANGYEISYHSNPRPTHEEMGGRQYAIGNGRKINGKYYPPFSSVEGLLSDYGCLHFKFPIILGVSVPAYSDKELKAMKEQSKQKVMFEGKEHTMYECKQMQRQLETVARHAKDRQIIAKASGDDVLRRLEQERINAITHKYKQLSDASGLPTKMERMSVPKYHKVKENSELSSAKRLNNTNKNDIINTELPYLNKKKRLIKHEIQDCYNTTNPKYNLGTEYKVNCQRCVSAYEARRRGIDVTAKAAIMDGTDTLPYMMNPKGWANVYENGLESLETVKGLTGKKIKDNICSMMREYGDGARAIIRVQWQGRNSGHVFIAEQVNGVTQFIDPQSSTRNVSSYFNKGMIKPSSTRLLRIDNKRFTDLIEKCVK